MSDDAGTHDAGDHAGDRADQPTGDTAAHLSAAARELIAAGRNWLDQLERAVDRPGGLDDTVRRWIDLGQAAVDGFVGGAPDHSHLDGDVDDDDDLDDDQLEDATVIDLRDASDAAAGRVVQSIQIDDLRPADARPNGDDA